MTDRDDYPAAAAKAARVPPAGLDPALMVRLLVDVRAGQARPQRHRLRGRPALHRRPDRRAPSGGRRGPRAVPPARRRRVPGRQPAAAGPARPVARRPRGALRRRRPEPDHLHLRRRLAGLPARLPPAAPVGHRGAAGPRLPLHAAGRRPGQQDHHRQRARAAQRPRAGRPAAGRSGARPARRCPTSRPRPPRRDPGAGPAEGRYAGQRGRDPVPHQRPERDLRAGAGRRRPALRAARRRAVLRPARGARGPPAAARRGPVGRLRRPAVDRARRALRRRLARHPARERRRGPRALGVAGGAGPAGRRPGRRRGGRDACATSSPSWTSGPMPSTPRPSRASRSRRCTRPRAWSGTPSSSSAPPRACSRSATPRPRSRSRRSAGCCTSASPGPASTCRSPGRSPGHPVAGPGGGRPGSWTACTPSSQPPAARGARGAQGPREPAGSAARRSPRRWPASWGAARTARRRTTRTLFERLREWRAEQAREASVPAYVVFTDATLTALAEVRPTTEPALLGISGHRPDQAGAVRRRRARPLRGRSGGLPGT